MCVKYDWKVAELITMESKLAISLIVLQHTEE